jgi:hypothetical protein
MKNKIRRRKYSLNILTTENVVDLYAGLPTQILPSYGEIEAQTIGDFVPKPKEFP